jgi:predicted RNA-binding Zn ribbon-like protein
MTSTTKIFILVSMKLSAKFLVPSQLALLYDFVNSIDLRQYTENGVRHESHDELATARQLEDWLRERELLDPGAHLSAHGHRTAVKLRAALRDYLQVAPEDRSREIQAAVKLNEISRAFPLVVAASAAQGDVSLTPAPGSSPLAWVLAEFHLLAATVRLDRLKMCCAQECRWVFFDRSKPGNRRWCSSALCGNRHKTRSYRQRQRQTV